MPSRSRGRSPACGEKLQTDGVAKGVVRSFFTLNRRRMRSGRRWPARITIGCLWNWGGAGSHTAKIGANCNSSSIRMARTISKVYRDRE